MEEIVPSFKETILVDDINNLGIDFMEIGLDALIDNEVVKDIPIVKSLFAVGKTAIAIRNRHLLKKTLVFIQEMKSGKLNQTKFEDYKQRLTNDKFKEQEIERVIIILDRFIDNIRAKYLAKIYVGYINSNINWDEFCDFSEIIDKLLISDFVSLQKSYSKQKFYENDEIFDSHKRFESYGLMMNKNYFGTVWLDDGSGQELISMTDKGNMLASLIFK